MPPYLTKVILVAGLVLLVAAGVFMMFFSAEGTKAGAADLRLSSVNVGGKTITICKDERIVSDASGLIDFSVAPSAQLDAFEAFARQHSKTFVQPDAKQRQNANWKRLARKCKADRPKNAIVYAMSKGDHPERAVYDVYVVDGSVTHIDGFYLNRENEVG